MGCCCSEESIARRLWKIFWVVIGLGLVVGQEKVGMRVGLGVGLRVGSLGESTSRDPNVEDILATLSPNQRLQMLHRLQQDPEMTTPSHSYRSASVRESATHGGTDTMSSSTLHRSCSSAVP